MILISKWIMTGSTHIWKSSSSWRLIGTADACIPSITATSRAQRTMQLPHGQAKGTPSMILRGGRPTNKHQRHPGIEQCRWSGPTQTCQIRTLSVFTGPWLILTSTIMWEPGFHLISRFLFSLECQLLEEEGFNPALSLQITLSGSNQIFGSYCKFRKFDHKTFFFISPFLLVCLFKVTSSWIYLIWRGFQPCCQMTCQNLFLYSSLNAQRLMERVGLFVVGSVLGEKVASWQGAVRVFHGLYTVILSKYTLWISALMIKSHYPASMGKATFVLKFQL